MTHFWRRRACARPRVFLREGPAMAVRQMLLQFAWCGSIIAAGFAGAGALAFIQRQEPPSRPAAMSSATGARADEPVFRTRVAPGNASDDMKPSPPSEVDQPPETRPPSRNDVGASANRSTQERVEYLSFMFEQQPYDRSWARETERELRARLVDNSDAGSNVRELSCRSTLCRASLEFENEEGYRQFFEGYLSTPSWTGPGMLGRVSDPSETAVRMVMYFGKRGEPFPELRLQQ